MTGSIMSTPGPRKRWPQILGIVSGLGLIVLLVSALFSRFGRSEPQQRSERPVVSVTTVAVSTRPLRRTQTVCGALYGYAEVTLTPKIDGPVLRAHANVDDIVEQGRTLLEIDPTDYRHAADEAQAALNRELRKLGLNELPPPGYDVKKLNPVINAATLKDLAEANHKSAMVPNAATEQERIKARSDLLVAEVNYQQALLDGAASLQELRRLKAVLEKAEQYVRDTRIVVPTVELDAGDDLGVPASQLTWVVAGRGAISRGEMVRGSFATPLFKLIVDQALKLHAQLPERYLDVVRKGQEVELHVEACPGRCFKGRVARLGQVDQVSRSFPIEVLVPNPERLLRSGCFARAEIILGENTTAQVVPEVALTSFAGVTKVFLVDREGESTVVREHLVSAGVEFDVLSAAGSQRWVEVKFTRPVPSSAEVVTSGQSQLADGSIVRVVKRDDPHGSIP
jgi:multidrug efflux pump subunit AcrA (membrane-fusion protein)